MFTLLPMTEINSTRTCFRRSGGDQRRAERHSEWGKLTIVYRPSEADITILVTSRASEDLMAVYDCTRGRVAISSGASWVVTVSSPAKLR